MREKIKKWVDNLKFVGQFAMDDFKAKYTGSAMGVIWAFFQPLITIGIYWFVFQLGFKSQPVQDFQFILWLTSGLLPWFLFSDAISNSTACLLEYSYLVKKVLFNVNILPSVKVISALMVQAFLILLNIVLFCVYGHFPDLYVIQVVYYLIFTVVFILGIVYLTSALFVFLKDLAQIVAIFLQVLFWATPIVWDFNIMADKVIVQKILRLNPLYYLVNGYRDAFINKVWFWENPAAMLYYWAVALLVLFVGVKMFKRLKPHFADIL